MTDTRAALAELIRQIDEISDYDDISRTLDALTASADRTLVPALTAELHRFLDEENFYGRDVIADALARLQGTGALPELLRAAARDLGDDRDTLHGEIIGLLEADRAAARPVVLALSADPDPAVRRTGLWALGFVPGPQDVDLLVTAVADRDAEIRAMAVNSLPAADDRAFLTVVAALGDPDTDVRVAAVSRLGYSHRPDAVPHLSGLAGDHADRVRYHVAYACAQIGSPDATPTLLRLRDDPDPRVRDRAVHALGAVGGPAAVDALRAMAEDPDPAVRVAAASALPHAAATDARARRLLGVLATDEVPEVRTALVSGLAGARGRDTFGDLVRALADDPHDDVRQRIAVTVRRLAPSLAPSILDRYRDDPKLRAVAERELARLAG